jgi:drug/metabolite transporter (DMT)-like permease
MKRNSAIVILFIVSLIWGGGFICVKMCIESGMSPGLVTMLRGLVFSLAVFLIFPQKIISMDKSTFKNGLLVGSFNFLSFILQCEGAKYTTPARSSFLSGSYVALVPFLMWAIYKTSPKIKNLVAIAVCIFGMVVLSGFAGDGEGFNIGDWLTLLNAFFFALSIVMIAKRPKSAHFAQSSFMMGITLFVGSGLYALIFERPDFTAVNWKVAMLPFLYLALVSSLLGQTLQVVAQKYVEASTAGLIIMLESVFGAVYSVILGFDRFTLNLLVGGFLIFLSLVISQADFKIQRKAEI